MTRYRHTRRAAPALRRAPRGLRWHTFALGAVALGLVIAFDLGGRLNPEIVHMVERKTEYLIETTSVLVDRACPESATIPVRVTYGAAKGYAMPRTPEKAPSRTKKGR